MSRPATLTVPDKAGILDFLAHLVKEWNGRLEPWMRLQSRPKTRIQTLRFVLEAVEDAQGQLPVVVSTETIRQQVLSEWKEDFPLPDEYFDRACRELEQILAAYRPQPTKV